MAGRLGRGRSGSLVWAGLVALLGMGAGVKVAWERNGDPGVVSYGIYQGVRSGSYTNVTRFAAGTVCVDQACTGVVQLASGAVNFLVGTAGNGAGLESDFSSETAAREVVATVFLESSAEVTGPWGARGSLSVTGWVSGGEFFRGRMVVR